MPLGIHEPVLSVYIQYKYILQVMYRKYEPKKGF
jgi:hypothetical protein